MQERATITEFTLLEEVHLQSEKEELLLPYGTHFILTNKKPKIYCAFPHVPSNHSLDAVVSVGVKTVRKLLKLKKILVKIERGKKKTT